MTTTVQFRAPSDLKKNVQTILGSLGLDLSTAMNMYLWQIVRRGGIPFPVLTENGMTPEAEAEILRDTEDAMKSKKSYRSAEELHADILSE
ncbi:MAG: type II toxin-antitoxin system RelB/DinJ family antitoxin [Candidatus Peribacteraceae bacterium]|nr:type II toxin-antitoxin system RelB/DinJ family antitoxin [Candidatus Peribacteraceae bacterium]